MFDILYLQSELSCCTVYEMKIDPANEIIYVFVDADITVSMLMKLIITLRDNGYRLDFNPWDGESGKSSIMLTIKRMPK